VSDTTPPAPTPDAAARQRHRRTFPTMGTVASVFVVGAGAGAGAGADAGTDEGAAHVDAATGRLRAIFDRWEDEFSRYRASSPATAISEGRLRLQDSSELHRETYARAIQWRNRTGGAFDPHRADGSIDLAGIVKAAAMEEAGQELLRLGHADWCLNVGGDVLTAGSIDDRAWSVGIVHPDDRSRLWRTMTLDEGRRAVATSGTAERGEHIRRLASAKPVGRRVGQRISQRISQCSVAAADIVTADVLATAIMAGGRRMAEAAAAEWNVRVLAAFEDGSALSL
jgi:FAD:protein FMN transferase